MTGGCGEVGTDGAEGLGSMHGAHAAGDLDAELAHPDDPFSLAVIEGNPQVVGKPQVITLAIAHADGQGVPFLLQLAAPGGVQGDPGGGCVTEPAAVLFQDFRADRVLAGGEAACGASAALSDELPPPNREVNAASKVGP